MKKTMIALVLGVQCVAAVDTAPLPEDGWKEDFNSFAGSCASLPVGMSVSKDGVSPMLSDDPDFRGTDNGNVTAGGCYAWCVAEGDNALGYQPTAEEFTPGWFQVAFSNSAARPYRYLKISYEVVCLNNGDRSSLLELEIHLPNGEIMIPANMSFCSEKSLHSPASWTRTSLSCCLKLPSPIEPGQTFLVRWAGNDDGGSGSRDEYGVDNISVKGIVSQGTIITVR